MRKLDSVKSSIICLLKFFGKRFQKADGMASSSFLIEKTLLRNLLLSSTIAVLFSVFSFKACSLVFGYQIGFGQFLALVLLSVLVGCLVSTLVSIKIIDGIRETFVLLTNTQMQNKTLPLFLLDDEINNLYQHVQHTHKMAIENAKMASIGQLASQLAHDIRSPLAALDVAVSQLGNLPEENRILIRRAVQRIHDIANDLLHKRKSGVVLNSGSAETTLNVSSDDNKSVQLLSGVVEALISEKRLQFRSRIGIEIEGQIDQDAHGMFATIQLTEFKRVLSNLINNAVEALGESGRVFVKLHRQEKNAVIEISDNGKGIPPEILPKLMQQGETHGKQGGSGLGLYHARTSVESWGGSVKLDSVVDQGTTVKVSLPLQEPPDWFVPEIKIDSGSTVVVIDDDNSIHEIWRQRFEPLVKKGEITLRHFSSPDEFETWCGRGDGGDLYLCDYEFLNHKKNGVDLIRGLGINRKSILVTSRFEEDHVRKGCHELGVQLIPKTLAGFVPITMDVPPLSPVDAILIDDDDLVHMNWKMKAKISRKQIKTFTHPDSFYSELQNISKDTPIYVDSSLSDSIKGEDVAKKLSEAGFDNLFLATGYDKSNFPPMPWLRDIVGKNPPW